MSSRDVRFNDGGWNDFLYWVSADKKILKKLNRLIEETLRTPYEGIGKPELLTKNYRGYWSRRITEADRLIYKVSDDEILVIACRRHYDDK
jgi:toxin YoeB